MELENFKKILTGGHQYNHLYHFTDEANIALIKKHGLLSKSEAAKRGVKIPVPGGNELSRLCDSQKGLDDYVNLCFTTNHPMCFRGREEGRFLNPLYLTIDVLVLEISGVKITLDVANKSGVPLLDVDEGLRKLDYEVLYKKTDWKNPEIQARLQLAEKCEILVPNNVPVRLIKGGI